MAYSDRYRPRDPAAPQITVKQALEALSGHTKSTRAQHLIKSLGNELEGADAGQTDKSEPTPGQRAAASAAPNLDGRQAATSARD